MTRTNLTLTDGANITYLGQTFKASHDSTNVQGAGECFSLALIGRRGKVTKQYRLALVRPDGSVYVGMMRRY